MWGRAPTSKCNALYPSYSFVRKEAGGPLSANVYKCRLQPIDATRYGVAFSADEKRRLKQLFPAGVCDFDKPSVGHQHLIPSL